MKTAILSILCLIAFAGSLHAQASVSLSPDPKLQMFDDNGDPLTGGKVCTYLTGTNTPTPTYTDYTGVTQNTNPVVLDIAGRAQIWYDVTKTYRVVLRNPGTDTTCATGTVIWTVDGVSTSTIRSAGNLPPIFTTSVVGNAITFTLSNAAANTILGNFTGSPAPPTYGAPGATTQVIYNCAGGVCGSDKFVWDNAGLTLSLKESGSTWLSFHQATGTGEGEIRFGNITQFPRIKFVNTDWDFTSKNSQDFHFGPQSDPFATIIGGDQTVAHGTIRTGIGSAEGIIELNDGNSAAGNFAGAQIIMGSVADPNGSVSGETGSLFLTTAGGANTTLWIKESSPTAITGWIAK